MTHIQYIYFDKDFIIFIFNLMVHKKLCFICKYSFVIIVLVLFVITTYGISQFYQNIFLYMHYDEQVLHWKREYIPIYI